MLPSSWWKQSHWHASTISNEVVGYSCCLAKDWPAWGDTGGGVRAPVQTVGVLRFIDFLQFGILFETPLVDTPAPEWSGCFTHWLTSLNSCTRSTSLMVLPEYQAKGHMGDTLFEWVIRFWADGYIAWNSRTVTFLAMFEQVFSSCGILLNIVEREWERYTEYNSMDGQSCKPLWQGHQMSN